MTESERELLGLLAAIALRGHRMKDDRKIREIVERIGTESKADADDHQTNNRG